MWWSILPSFALTVGCMFIPGVSADRLVRFVRYNDKNVIKDSFDATDFQLTHRDYFIMGSKYVRRGMDFLPEVD